MIEKYYNICINKNFKNLKIALFSDLHFSNIYVFKNNEKIIKSIEKNKPYYILIPGDIIDSIKIIEKFEKEIINFLKEISTLSPVIISLGNHDLPFALSKKIFEKIAKIKNVFFLNNEFLEIENFCFIGSTLSEKYFQNKEKDMTEISNNFKKIFPTIQKNYVNILLCHSPKYLLNDNLFKDIPSYKNIDLIVSGHMHNGMIPNFLDRLFKNNIGLISPQKKIFSNLSRGILEKDLTDKKVYLVVSGGISKIHENFPKIFHPFVSFYKPEIDYITLSN